MYCWFQFAYLCASMWFLFVEEKENNKQNRTYNNREIFHYENFNDDRRNMDNASLCAGRRFHAHVVTRDIPLSHNRFHIRYIASVCSRPHWSMGAT
jgi:hypothetical protein